MDSQSTPPQLFSLTMMLSDLELRLRVTLCFIDWPPSFSRLDGGLSVFCHSGGSGPELAKLHETINYLGISGGRGMRRLYRDV